MLVANGVHITSASLTIMGVVVFYTMSELRRAPY